MENLGTIPLPMFGLSQPSGDAPAAVRAEAGVFLPLFTSTRNLVTFLERTALNLRPRELHSRRELWNFAKRGAAICDAPPPTPPSSCWIVVDPVELSGETCRPYPAEKFLEALESQMG